MNRAIAVLLCVFLCAAAMPPARGDAGRTADDNNGFDTAAVLPPAGEFVTGSLDVADDIADFYKLDVSAGDIINLSLYIVDHVPSSPGQVDFNVGLFNPSRVALGWSNSTYRYDSLKELALVCGTYYVEVSAVSGSGGYSLDYSTGPAPAVQNGMTLKGFLTNTTNRNTDWYRVQLSGGADAERFAATLHEDPGVNFDMYFMDLWSGYSFWYDISWAGDPDEMVDAVGTYTGYYYLKVYDFYGVGNYTLNITVEPALGHPGSAPAGAKAISYNSSLGGHVDMANEHYNWYGAQLAQGETITASMRLDPQPTDMFALSILQPDLRTLEGWSKTNFVDQAPPTLARQVSITKAAPSAGTYYIVAMAKVGLGSSVVDLSDRNAASDYILTVNMSAHVPPPVNHPPSASPPGIVVEMDENSGYDYDLGRIFSDPDNDALRFSVQGAVHVSVEFNNTTGNASFVPAHNWYGNENITITAADPYDTSATAWVNITVHRVPLPPEILERSPARMQLNETNGSLIRFRVFAQDAEGAPVSYSWRAGGASLAAIGNFTDWKVPSDSGAFEIVVTVSSGNLSSPVVWQVVCYPRPKLELKIVQPLNNTAVEQGKPVRFLAMVIGLPTADLANMTFAWYIENDKIGEGYQFCSTALPVGNNTVEVRAQNRSEPAQDGRASVVVFVKPRPAAVDKMPILMTWAVIGTAAAVAAIVLLVLVSRRSSREDDEEDQRRDDERSERRRREARRKRKQRRLARKGNR